MAVTPVRALSRAPYAAMFVLVQAGCWGNSTTFFPAGLEPWDATNMATPPAAQAGDAYPEQITYARTFATLAGITNPVPSVHARAYIQAPLADVWEAARDPQTGRDPVSSHGFAVLAWETEPAYAYSYRTHVVVNNFVTVEWDVAWRHGIVEGTQEAPTVTATRWQKVSGNAGIQVLEGSLVLRTVPGHPEVTAVEYQYHLQAPFSGHNTIEGYLGVVYGRLKDRAHHRALSPADCMNCPQPPASY